jgi:hypothetical protein
MRRFLIITALIVTIILPIAAFDGFTDIFGPAEDDFFAPTIAVEESASKASFNGALSFNIEGMKSKNGDAEVDTSINGGLGIDLGWKGSIVDAKVTLDLIPKTDRTTLEWVDIFKILSITTYFEGGRVEAGLLKKEWGSGDGVHVVDVLNAPDYRNGITDDPLEMKMAEPMIVTTATWKDTTIELVYKPMLIPMVAAEKPENRWFMPSISIGDLNIPAMGPPFAGVDFNNIKVNFPKTAPEELSRLSNSQWGARVKTKMGPADLGLIYYNGFYSQPYAKANINLELTDDDPPVKIKDIDIALIFTGAQLFGLEGTIISGPFTFMVEGGFWLSEDYKGEKIDKYNNKWVYLAGVGFNIPKTSGYLSLTYNGQYIVGLEKNNSVIPNPSANPTDPIETYLGDADYIQALLASNGKPYMNTLTAAIEFPVARERVKLRMAGTYQVETQGYALLPSVTWSIADDLVFSAKGRFFGTVGSTSADSMFKKWSNNGSLNVGISYLF